MTRILYLLIGPKGAGKTHIGRLAAAHTEIDFIAAEAIWLALRPGEDGWRKVEEQIAERFAAHEKVMIESLGAGEAFQAFYARLAARYTIKMIRVSAGVETCLQRVASRDAREQLPIALEQVAAYNRIAAAVAYEWSLEIDNDPPLADEEIVARLRTL